MPDHPYALSLNGFVPLDNVFSASATDTTQTFWPIGDASASRDPATISSAQVLNLRGAAGNTDEVIIRGLDENYAGIGETVTLNGTTNVTTTLSYLRLNYAEVAGDGAASSAIDISTDSGHTNKIGNIYNGCSSTMAIYFTVPKGKVFEVHSMAFGRGNKITGSGNVGNVMMSLHHTPYKAGSANELPLEVASVSYTDADGAQTIGLAAVDTPGDSTQSDGIRYFDRPLMFRGRDLVYATITPSTMTASTVATFWEGSVNGVLRDAYNFF